jgi:hypothetical protein
MNICTSRNKIFYFLGFNKKESMTNNVSFSEKDFRDTLEFLTVYKPKMNNKSKSFFLFFFFFFASAIHERAPDGETSNMLM